MQHPITGQPDQNQQPYSYLSDPRRDKEEHNIKQAGAGATVDIQSDSAFQTTSEGSMQGTQPGTHATISSDIMRTTADNPLLQPGQGGSASFNLQDYLDWLLPYENPAQGGVQDTEVEDFDPLTFAKYMAQTNANVNINDILNGGGAATATPTTTASSLTLAQLYQISDFNSSDPATVLEILKMLCDITGTPPDALVNLANKIAESNDPTSSTYGTIDLSSEDQAELSTTLTSLMGSSDPADVASLSSGLSALNTQLAQDLQSGDPVIVYNAVLASMGDIIPIDIGSTTTASASTPCTSGQLTDISEMNSTNQADVLSALLDLAGTPPPEPGSDIYNNLNTLAGKIALANQKGGLDGLYSGNPASVWQTIKNLIANNGEITGDQQTMDLLDNVISGNIGTLNAQYELDLQSTNPNIAMSAYLAGEGILLSPATSSDTSETVAVPFTADEITEASWMQSTNPNQVFAALLKTSGLTSAADPKLLATLYQLAQEIAASNDPSSESYGTIDLTSGTESDLEASIENAYTLNGGNASDIEALLSGSSLGKNLASLNTAFSAVPEAQANATMTALNDASALPPSPDVQALIKTITSGTVVHVAASSKAAVTKNMNPDQTSEFAGLNSQDPAVVTTQLETLTGIPAPVPPAQPTPQFQSLQNLATQIAKANSGQSINKNITPAILSKLSSEDPSDVLDALTQIYQQTDPNGGQDQSFISALGLAANTMSDFNTLYDSAISGSDATQSYNAFMAKLGNPPPFQPPLALPDATITVSQPLSTDQLMDLSNLNSKNVDDVYNVLLLMTGLSSEAVLDPNQTKELRALATLIANANNGQPMTDANGDPISPNLQAALMSALTSQNPQIIAQALQQLFTLTGATDTAFSGLLTQAASNIAAFYVQANIEINSPTADPTDVTNVQLALSGALTTSSTDAAGSAQASLTIDQRLDEQNICSPDWKKVLAGLESLAGITDPKTLTDAQLSALTLMAKHIATDNSSGGTSSLEVESSTDLQTALQGIYGGADPTIISFIGTMSINLSAINTQFDLDMQSTNPSVVLAAMEARSSLDTQNLSPAEKKIALTYLQLMAEALAFMSRIRAELSQKETELQTQQNQAKLQEVKTMIDSAIKNFDTQAKKIADNVSAILAAEAEKAKMAILGPVLNALAGLAAVLIEVFTLGTATAVAVALILITVSMTVLMAVDQSTGFMTNALHNAGLSDAATQGIEAAIYAVMAIVTFGAGAAASAAGAVTKAVVQALMMILIQCVFSTGLITTGFAAMYKACGGDDQGAMIFSMVMTFVMMIACCSAAAKAAGPIAEKIAARAAQQAADETAQAAAQTVTMTANPLFAGAAENWVDVGAQDTFQNLSRSAISDSANATITDGLGSQQATTQVHAAAHAGGQGGARTVAGSTTSASASASGSPDAAPASGGDDAGGGSAIPGAGGSTSTTADLQLEGNISRTNRMLERIGERLKEFFTVEAPKLTGSTAKMLDLTLMIEQLIQGLMQAGVSYQQSLSSTAQGQALADQADLVQTSAALDALYTFLQQQTTQFDKTIQGLQGDVKGMNDLVTSLDKMFEDFLASMRALIR